MDDIKDIVGKRKTMYKGYLIDLDGTAYHGAQVGGLSVVQAPGLWRVSSVVVALGLSCPLVCGIFPDQRSNPCFLL